MSDNDTYENYSDSAAQKAVAVATLLCAAGDTKDPEIKAEALKMAEAVRMTIEKPKASVSALAGGRGKTTPPL